LKTELTEFQIAPVPALPIREHPASFAVSIPVLLSKKILPRIMKKQAALALLFLALCQAGLFADVRLPSLLSDRMVLQQSASVTLWGWAYAGEKVVIETSWGEKAETVADTRGNWKVAIKTPKASPLDALRREWINFSVPKDENKIQIKDILIGEVWLASGQSNMMMWLGPDFPKGRNDWYGDKFWKEESARLSHPAIRIFNVENVLRPKCATIAKECFQITRSCLSTRLV
jgi:sialate O-acetylesterase